MKTHDISVLREVLKKADLRKVLPDSMVQELKKSKNIDFESDPFSEIRDVVTAIVTARHKYQAPQARTCTSV